MKRTQAAAATPSTSATWKREKCHHERACVTARRRRNSRHSVSGRSSAMSNQPAREMRARRGEHHPREERVRRWRWRDGFGLTWSASIFELLSWASRIHDQATQLGNRPVVYARIPSTQRSSVAVNPPFAAFQLIVRRASRRFIRPRAPELDPRISLVRHVDDRLPELRRAAVVDEVADAALLRAPRRSSCSR